MNSDSPATPSILAGRYKFVRTIARGGMSIIYLAQDIRLDRPVAVKVLFAGLAHNPAFVERFRREARSAAKLNHPHIVKVYDSGQDGNIYFIVMEYLEGMSLSEVLRREGSLGIETSMKIAEDVAEALSEAHKQGVIHRDIKPGNIIFVPSTGLKVADFGIARAISGSVSDLTQAGTVMGTATYFSPEQAKGEAVDYRTDLYSLGVVLFEMLSGKPPFHGDSPISVAYQHVQTRPPVLMKTIEGIPGALSDVVSRLLSKDPDARYQDAGQLQNDLRAIRKSGHLMLNAQDQRSPSPQLASAAPPRPPTQPPGGHPAMSPQGLPAQPPSKSPKSTTQVQVSRQRRRTALFWGFFALILAVIALIVTLVATNTRDSESETVTTIEVPSVVRLPEEEAERQLDDLGFEVVIERQENADIPPGQVIRQEPRAGSKEEDGTEIILTVSLGAEAIAVPDVIEYQLLDAQRVLREAGFETPSFIEVESSKPLGEVIDQDPRAGEQLQPGAPVVLSVSTGLLSAQVPNVVGLPISEAGRILSDLGLVIEQRRFSNNTVSAGNVISTDPQAGVQLPRGETVIVFISTGPSVLAVPDVIGLDEFLAVSELRSWGLEVSVIYQEVLAGEIAGTVVAQNPLPNTNFNPSENLTATITVGTPSNVLAPETSLGPPQELN